MPAVLLQLAADDPGARERLRRFWQRARVMAGVGGVALTDARPPLRVTGMTFPGDGLMFAAVTGFLILCCHVSWVHLLAPSLVGATWPNELFALLASLAAVVTWKLSQLRRGPRAVEEALPDPSVDAPLVELHDFVSAMRRELEASARLQRRLANFLFVGLLLIGVWGIVLGSFGHVRFAQLLVTAAGLTASFVGSNWRPYRSSLRRRHLAREAEGVAAALAEKIRDLGQAPRNDARATLEWTVVRDALSGALPLRRSPPVSRIRRAPRRRLLARGAR